MELLQDCREPLQGRLALQCLCWSWHSILPYIPFFLELVGAFLSLNSLGSWHWAALGGLPRWAIEEVWGAALSFPSPDFAPSPYQKHITSFTWWNNEFNTWIESTFRFAEIERKSWVFTEAAYFGSITKLSQSMLWLYQPPDAQSSGHTLMYCLPVMTYDFILNCFSSRCPVFLCTCKF